jgi:hypothetical protein
MINTSEFEFDLIYIFGKYYFGTYILKWSFTLHMTL